MFGIGIPEIIVILIIALFVIGPDKLPEVAKTLGKTLSEFKKVMDGVKSSIDEEVETVQKETDLPEFRMTLDDTEARLKKDYEEALGISGEEEKNGAGKPAKTEAVKENGKDEGADSRD